MDKENGAKRKRKKQVRRGKECVAIDCTSTEYLCDGASSKVHFFKFPSKPPLRTRWCNLIKRQHGKDGFFVNEKSVICDKHFKPEDIYRPPGGTRQRLLQGIEPSIFSWSNQAKQKTRAPPKHRRLPGPDLALSPHNDNDMNLEVTCTSTSIPTSLNAMLSSDDEEMDLEVHVSSPVRLHSMPQMVETSTQTDWSFGFPIATCNDHSYAYSFTDTTADPYEYQKTMEERLEVKSEMLNNLRAEIGRLQKEIEFRLEKFKDDDSAVLFYTGFPNYVVLTSFFEYIEPKVEKLQYWGSGNVAASQPYQEEGKKKPGRRRQLTPLNEFFMVLVRLKVGLFVKDVADRFGISMGHFSKIFCTWINFLYFELYQLFPFPSQEAVRRNMPEQFALYPTTRVIIDCTEVFVEVPSSMLAQSQTWSNYKHHNTFKVLVGISPNGQVTFISKLWGGRVSDKCITQQSGLFNLLQAGDNIMADRGFDVYDILPRGVHLNIPPFKGSREQLTAEEVQETVHIASVRIHVERAIGRIKCYHILDGTLPLSLAHLANQIFSVCSYLTNFLPPLLPPKEASHA